jgi:hypothetical protein
MSFHDPKRQKDDCEYFENMFGHDFVIWTPLLTTWAKMQIWLELVCIKPDIRVGWRGTHISYVFGLPLQAD